MEFNKSFASHEKSQFWSVQNKVSPHQVKVSSHTKYWFSCIPCGHEISISISNVCNGFWCPHCSVPCKKLCENPDCSFCFEKSFASHEKAKHWSTQNQVTPRDILKGTKKEYLFDCPTCNHTFEKSITQITSKNSSFCGYCSISHPMFCGNKECTHCFKRSFASHESAKHWSTQNTRLPHAIALNCNDKYKFDCPTCKHTYENNLSNAAKGRGCSFCNGNKLCENDKCTFCFEKSFASNPLSKYWDSKNKVFPRQVNLCSNTKYWFNCNTCTHIFDRPLSVMSDTVNSHCPYCVIPSKILCEDSSCKTCFDRSFASHEKSSCWSDKNGKPARMVFKHSCDKYILRCDKCNFDFENTLNHISGRNDWCPKCKNKTETKLYLRLQEKYNVEHQFKAEWCKKIKCLPFDFCIPNFKIIIELDGRQHFEHVQNWQSPQETQTNDIFKQKCANENGYSVIRILQTDVYNDTYNWFLELCQNIEIIKTNGIQNIYMCKNNEYVNYITV